MNHPQRRSHHTGHPPRRQHPYYPPEYYQPEDVGSQLARVEPYYPAPPPPRPYPPEPHYYYHHPEDIGSQLARVEPYYPPMARYPEPPAPQPQRFYIDDIETELSQVEPRHHRPAPGNKVVAKVAIEADPEGLLHLRMVGPEEVINLSLDAFQLGAEQMMKSREFKLRRDEATPVQVTVEQDPPPKQASEEYRQVMASIAAERERVATPSYDEVGNTGNALFDGTFIALSRWCGFTNPVLIQAMALLMALVFSVALYRGAQYLFGSTSGGVEVADVISEPGLDRALAGRSPPRS